jgi:hypothetical protein
MRRILLAFGVSFAVHLLVVAIAAGFGLWRSLSLIPAVKMQPISIDVVKELPLGPPPGPEPDDEPPARKPRPKHRVATARDGVTVAAGPDAGPPEGKSDAAVSNRAYDGGGSGIDGGRRRPGDLREHGPEGSRLTAVLRLDRVRNSAGSDKTIAAIDQLLMLLPDRRRLIEGTGLNLYNDFESLIVATPNPTDDAVTFLAVRHRLSDSAFKTELDRGAKAANKPIEWQTLGGRPVGLRRQPSGSPTAVMDRDDRIIVLPRPSLAIMAPPAYAALLLDVDPTARPADRIDGGAPDAQGAELRRKTVTRARWQSVAARIDALEGDLPDDAAFMMMATGLFAPVTGPIGYVVPPTRGASDDQPPQPVTTEASPPPQTMILVVGLESAYLEVSAVFASEADADRWERELPAWRRKLVTNPAVFLTGIGSLIGRAENSREGSTLRLRASTTTEELQRLLNLAANLTRAAQTHRRE